MYKLWHSDLKPPIVIETKEELLVYIQLMRTIGKGTPRFEELPDEMELSVMELCGLTLLLLIALLSSGDWLCSNNI